MLDDKLEGYIAEYGKNTCVLFIFSYDTKLSAKIIHKGDGVRMVADNECTCLGTTEPVPGVIDVAGAKLKKAKLTERNATSRDNAVASYQVDSNSDDEQSPTKNVNVFHLVIRT